MQGKMVDEELNSSSDGPEEKKEEASTDDSLEDLEEANADEAEEPKTANNSKDAEGRKSPATETDAESEAINKFKGELSKIKGGDSSGDDDRKTKKKRSYNKGDRPAKRPKQRISHYVREAPPSTFVMKLFDRSIDLTQFTEDTPLYPICRSWFMNNPKTLPGKRESKKRDERMRERDHYTLPEALPAVGELAPSPLLTPHPVTPDFELEYDPDIPLPSREELLAEHYENWAKAKKFHNNESAKRERCYKPSLSILRDLYCSRLV